MSVHHVFLTRFNLPSRSAETFVRARPSWLEERIALFERYTVPSVRQQTRPGSAWIVYVDPASPAWLLERMEAFREQGVLTPVLRESVSPDELRADLRRVAGASAGDVLVTTNLDNDDGLARDFVERLLAADPGEGPTAVYLTRGLVLTTQGAVFARHDRYNAFCSVREPSASPVTCWADWHNELHRSMPVVEVDGGSPAWLQIVHGANVSNRVRGRRTDPSAHRSRFGHLLDEVPRPTAGVLARDLLVEAPWRATREAARATAKAAVYAVGGQAGIARIKVVLAAPRVVLGRVPRT